MHNYLGIPVSFRDAFSSAAYWASHQCGRGSTFVAAVAVIVIWAITGPLFHWSDTWQLIINTGTTIITFLMVFLIQNTQNRDTQAIHLKLDELIRANVHARNRLLCLEDLTEDQLQEVKSNFAKLAEGSPAAAEEVDAATRELERAHQRVRKVANRPGPGARKRG